MRRGVRHTNLYVFFGGPKYPPTYTPDAPKCAIGSPPKITNNLYVMDVRWVRCRKTIVCKLRWAGSLLENHCVYGRSVGRSVGRLVWRSSTTRIIKTKKQGANRGQYYTNKKRGQYYTNKKKQKKNKGQIGDKQRTVLHE